MKRGLVSHGVCLSLGSVVTLALVVWQQHGLEHAVAQDEGTGAPLGNGDVNGDGRLNIGDAIYIINNQFRGGPAPVPIVFRPAVLPATGQTHCYNHGLESLCEGVEGGTSCAGQDGFYEAGCPSEGRFADSGDGTVTDNCTGLMWQNETADTNGDTQIDDADALPWCDALNYCVNLDFAGHDDWRLPNVRELLSILDYGRTLPSIDPVFGVLSSSTSHYWTSTTYAFNPDVARRVRFDVGFLDGNNKGAPHHLRAVRNAP